MAGPYLAVKEPTRKRTLMRAPLSVYYLSHNKYALEPPQLVNIMQTLMGSVSPPLKAIPATPNLCHPLPLPLTRCHFQASPSHPRPLPRPSRCDVHPSLPVTTTPLPLML